MPDIIRRSRRPMRSSERFTRIDPYRISSQNAPARKVCVLRCPYVLFLVRRLDTAGGYGIATVSPVSCSTSGIFTAGSRVAPSYRPRGPQGKVRLGHYPPLAVTTAPESAPEPLLLSC